MSIVLQGSTSGSITLQEPDVAGSNTLTLPAATGTVALTENFTGSNVSLTTDGYQKLPSGLIMQWGTTPSISNDGSYAVTFPIAFPTACVTVQVCGKLGATTASAAYSIGTGNYTTTGVTIYNDASTQTTSWFAVGY